MNLHTQETIGYELLARWQHPTLGLIEPEAFIPIAEDTGAIGALTDSMLTQGVRDARNWPAHIHLSVNLSPRQFADPLLAQRIMAILAEAGFPPQRLEIEITETAVVKRLDEAKITLKSLRNLGVRIALDDFGTGYSGLHHLRELQLDTIKIDQSFVTDMLKDAEDEKLVEAIVSLGRVLGLSTTAEGIETKDVLDKLDRARLRYRPRLSVRPAGALDGRCRDRRACPPQRLTSGAPAPSPSGALRAAAPTPPWRFPKCPA